MMKKLVFLLCLLFIGCTSPEKQAENSVKKYLLQNLNDPDSYRPDKFYKFDSVFTGYTDTNEGDSLLSVSAKSLRASQFIDEELNKGTIPNIDFAE